MLNEDVTKMDIVVTDWMSVFNFFTGCSPHIFINKDGGPKFDLNTPEFMVENGNMSSRIHPFICCFFSNFFP